MRKESKRQMNYIIEKINYQKSNVFFDEKPKKLMKRFDGLAIHSHIQIYGTNKWQKIMRFLTLKPKNIY